MLFSELPDELQIIIASHHPKAMILVNKLLSLHGKEVWTDALLRDRVLMTYELLFHIDMSFFLDNVGGLNTEEISTLYDYFITTEDENWADFMSRYPAPIDAFLKVCELGKVHMARVMLPGVDHPSAEDNHAIREASQNGHLEIVRLLLTDSRIDPSADDNYTIREASHNGHLEVVRLLLADPRVDPSADDNFAIREAGEYGHLE